METINYTEFASATRVSGKEITMIAKQMEKLPLLKTLLDSIPEIVLALNQERQIVFANQTAIQLLNLDAPESLYGLRPGEALQCVHSGENAAGCGTTKFCSTCGAVKAILSSQNGQQGVEECRITQKDGHAVDLRVTATPFKSASQDLVIFVASDISDEKRRHLLERTFFHDIMNTVTRVAVCADLLPDADRQDQEALFDTLSRSVKQLIDEIELQRGLLAAENDDLVIRLEAMSSLDFLLRAQDMWTKQRAGKGRVHISVDSVDKHFTSDPTVLGRVLGNMIKNALEAGDDQQIVTIGCAPLNGGKLRFWVHNPSVIPNQVQLQIFNRSFSTKGQGRGIGTYSMKLLAERYLKGQVSFTSSKEAGTVFQVDLPALIYEA